MDYTTLVNQIMEDVTLSAAIEEISKATGALNLVTPAWRDLLKDSPIYQLHASRKVKYSKSRLVSGEKASVNSILNPSQRFNVIVTGDWSLETKDNNPSVVCRQSDPLKEIGLIMKENEDISLHDGGRFYFLSCPVFSCHYCEDSHKKAEIPIAPVNSCILTTRVYDGRILRNEYASVLQANLSRTPSFKAIFNIEVKTRVTFGERYKISGLIRDIIIFPENFQRKKSELVLSTTGLSIPKITYEADLETLDLESLMN